MKECMATAKPQVSILLATYEPRMDWLRQQLLSLDAQTYPSIKLYVRDDGSTAASFEETRKCVEECIRSFPYEIQRNEENLGSNITFERLTRDADGEYFAYCDQDDIWLPEKIAQLEEQLSASRAELICSDVILIDGEGNEFAKSITELRRRHIFLQGEGLAPKLIYRNFVIGCTAMIRAETAKSALPFARHMVHDHYLAFYCAMRGPIEVSSEHLVRYRIHENNQTGVLAHVTDRKSYIENHMYPFCDRVAELQERFFLPELDKAAQWAQARKKNAARQTGGMKMLWALRHVNQMTTLFELIALRFPEFLFRPVLRWIQTGKM